MASLDFDTEKSAFREFYDDNLQLLEGAKNSVVALINSLVSHNGGILLSKMEGRIKNREECISKFNRKYRPSLESKSESYELKGHITDLIGIRVVCLYEDDIEKMRHLIETHFQIIDITDKINQIEKTEDSFGYKGLHLDIKLNGTRSTLPEYEIYNKLQFELQIRTIIQDSWSVLDHKIKYKKSIPNPLKRRINTLAALFELADREFRAIRDSTIEEIKKEEIQLLETAGEEVPFPLENKSDFNHPELNAFSFLRIARHFFSQFEFEPHKVDGFTQEIVSLSPGITKGKFNFYMRNSITKAKQYQKSFEEAPGDAKLNPYTIIRHCLYIGDRGKFSALLTNTARESFEKWLVENAD